MGMKNVSTHLWQSVTWQEGWVTLLYGANGSGKTTWLKHLAVEWAPVYYSGHTLGWLPHLSVKENLRLWQKFYKGALSFSIPFANIPWGDLSQGQKQYMAFVGAELSGCRLWLMDEPFVHMDADHISLAHNICRTHLGKSGGVVLTSHQSVVSFWPDVHAWLVDSTHLPARHEGHTG